LHLTQVRQSANNLPGTSLIPPEVYAEQSHPNLIQYHQPLAGALMEARFIFLVNHPARSSATLAQIVFRDHRCLLVFIRLAFLLLKNKRQILLGHSQFLRPNVGFRRDYLISGDKFLLRQPLLLFEFNLGLFKFRLAKSKSAWASSIVVLSDALRISRSEIACATSACAFCT